jgi:hypothetical protein
MSASERAEMRGAAAKVPAAVVTAEMRVAVAAAMMPAAVTTPMAAAVTAAFWAGQRETR